MQTGQLATVTGRGGGEGDGKGGATRTKGRRGRDDGRHGADSCPDVPRPRKLEGRALRVRDVEVGADGGTLCGRLASQRGWLGRAL